METRSHSVILWQKRPPLSREGHHETFLEGITPPKNCVNNSNSGGGFNRLFWENYKNWILRCLGLFLRRRRHREFFCPLRWGTLPPSNFRKGALPPIMFEILSIIPVKIRIVRPWGEGRGGVEENYWGGGQNFWKRGFCGKNFLAAPKAPLKIALFIQFFADIGGAKPDFAPPPCPPEERLWERGPNPSTTIQPGPTGDGENSSEPCLCCQIQISITYPSPVLLSCQNVLIRNIMFESWFQRKYLELFWSIANLT